MKSVAVTSRSFSKHPMLREELSKKYQRVTFNDAGKTLSDEALIDFLQDHDMAIIGLERMHADILKQLPKLKVISRFGVGLDTLDIVTMKTLGIKLAYTRGANKRAVSELVIGLAINMLRQLPFSNHELLTGIWRQNKGRQLSGKTIGIIGLGEIGKDLVSLLRVFDCKIYAFDVSDQTDFCRAHQIKQVDLDSLLSVADVVTLHIPLNSATRLLLNEQRLSLMKPSAILINAARGGLVDEQALKLMLQNNRLAGAAFDVYETEPPVDKELLSLPNFFATPHIGGSTEEAILAMGQAAITGLETAECL